MYTSWRKERKERGMCICVLYGLIIDESEGVVWAATILVSPGMPTKCPLCTACYANPNSMRGHLRRSHSDFRKVSKGTGSTAKQQNRDTDSAGTHKRPPTDSSHSDPNGDPFLADCSVHVKYIDAGHGM